MLITNARQDETGDWEFDLNLRAEEVDFLVNFATQALLSQGLISLQEQEEEQEVELPQQNAPTSDNLN